MKIVVFFFPSRNVQRLMGCVISLLKGVRKRKFRKISGKKIIRSGNAIFWKNAFAIGDVKIHASPRVLVEGRAPEKIQNLGQHRCWCSRGTSWRKQQKLLILKFIIVPQRRGGASEFNKARRVSMTKTKGRNYRAENRPRVIGKVKETWSNRRCETRWRKIPRAAMAANES